MCIIVVAAVVCLGFLSACEQDPSGSQVPVVPPAPQQRDRLVLALPSDPEGFDPHLGNVPLSTDLYALLYDTLVTYEPWGVTALTPDSSPEAPPIPTPVLAPGLATSWDISDDGLTYTFKLRKGVQFTDGTAFNAESVKFNFDRQLDAAKKTLFAPVQSYKVVDEDTFQVRLKRPSYDFLERLTSPAAAGIASPAAISSYGADFYKNPVGTGPFTLESWKKGDRVTFKANAGYWGGQPALDKIVCVVIPGPAERMEKLMSGEVDIITGESMEVEAVEGQVTQGVEGVLSVPSFNSYMLHFRSWKKPFSDIRLRQAVAYAIDKRAIVEEVLGGLARPGTGIVPAVSPAHLASDPYPYDPEKAKELLAQAGYANGGPKVSILTNSHMASIAQAIGDDLRDVGFVVDIRSTDGSTFWAQLPTDVGDMVLDNWWLPGGDPSYLLESLLRSKGGDGKPNIDRYSNRDLDALLDRAAGSKDTAERAALGKEIQEKSAADLPHLAICYRDTVYAFRTAVEGLGFVPGGVRLQRATVIE